jgi:hypothetical protein
MVHRIIIKNETSFVLSVNVTKRQPYFVNLLFHTALSNAGPSSDSPFTLETKSRKFWIHLHAMGAYVTCIKHNNSLQIWDPEIVPKEETYVVDGLPTEAQ